MGKKYTFKELEQRIKDAVQDKAGFQFFADEQGMSLLDGFIMAPLQAEIGGETGYVIGGPAVPLVGVVGNRTGKVYYFALKALLPDLDI